MRMTIDLKGSEQLDRSLSEYERDSRRDGEKALRDIAVKWQMEAKMRIPVDTGLARNTILREQGRDSQGLFCAVGSNQKYSKYIEFGTKRIARGLVKALGLREDITDSQAIKIWPAKNANLVDEVTGKASRRAISAIDKRLASGGSQEQMPWLRTSFMAIRDWAIKRLAKAFTFE